MPDATIAPPHAPTQDKETTMRNRLFLLILAAIALSACSKQEAASAPAQAPVAETAAAPAKASQAQSTPTSPERIKQIEASGQTGLWSDVTDVCPGDVKNGLRTTLSWNVLASGATRVTVYVVGNNGREQHFGQGGPIGEKETGPWLKPGISFKIKDYNTGQDLGSIVIGEKSC